MIRCGVSPRAPASSPGFRLQGPRGCEREGSEPRDPPGADVPKLLPSAANPPGHAASCPDTERNTLKKKSLVALLQNPKEKEKRWLLVSRGGEKIPYFLSSFWR